MVRHSASILSSNDLNSQGGRVENILFLKRTLGIFVFVTLTWDWKFQKLYPKKFHKILSQHPLGFPWPKTKEIHYDFSWSPPGMEIPLIFSVTPGISRFCFFKGNRKLHVLNNCFLDLFWNSPILSFIQMQNLFKYTID